MRKKILSFLLSLLLVSFSINVYASDEYEKIQRPVCFQGYITGVFGSGMANYPYNGYQESDWTAVSPGFNFSAGVRVYSYFYGGLSFGFQPPFAFRGDTGTWDAWYSVEPVALDLRGYIPVPAERIWPFVNLTIGPAIHFDQDPQQDYSDPWEFVITGEPAKVGLSFSVVAGCEFTRFVLSVGYKYVGVSDNGLNLSGYAASFDRFRAHMFVTKVGVRIGRNPYDKK